MTANEHRATIVKTIIIGLNKSRDYDGDYEYGDTCVVTNLWFPRGSLSENCITYSNYGPIWMGLWLDEELRLDDEREEGHGNTLFPRWLAEVLNELSGLEIEESDIYDTY